MPQTDSHGLPLSTDSAKAAERFREGVILNLSAWPGASEAFDAALSEDPDFALAHAARARVHLMRSEQDAARDRISDAERLVARRGDERERSHVDVLSLAMSGRSAEALSRVYDHVDLWPRDVTILSLPLGAFGLLAFSGMADHDQARVELCERHAGSYSADDWWFLTHRGWSLAESGEVLRGRGMLERALEIRRRNANGAHALAHAMFEGGCGDDADRMLAEWLPDYDRSGVLHGHLAWHAALNALQRGEVERALDIYAESVRPSVSQGMPINIVTDGASLLWRIDAYGHGAPKALWSEVAAYARQAFPRPGHAFVDTHMALIEAAVGDGPALERRIAALDDMVAAHRLTAGPVAPAIGRAARAFARSDHAECVRLLEPLTGEIVRIGGSGAQRELLQDMLLIALMRSGEIGKARTILDRRLQRRPTPRAAAWRSELAA